MSRHAGVSERLCFTFCGAEWMLRSRLKASITRSIAATDSDSEDAGYGAMFDDADRIDQRCQHVIVEA